MINEWNEMKARHEQEIAEYLQRMADQGYSRSQAAQLLGKNTSTISHLVKKYNLKNSASTSILLTRLQGRTT